jgi:hypothetical protein
MSFSVEASLYQEEEEEEERERIVLTPSIQCV